MQRNAIKVGDTLEWHQIISNYGHVAVRPAKVIKVGARRITIEVPMRAGGTRRTVVTPERLRPTL